MQLTAAEIINLLNVGLISRDEARLMLGVPIVPLVPVPPTPDTTVVPSVPVDPQADPAPTV